MAIRRDIWNERAETEKETSDREAGRTPIAVALAYDPAQRPGATEMAERLRAIRC